MTAGPNTFLIGAPKCGTTALAQFLSEHPDCFLGYPKEPSYWSSDLTRGEGVARITTEADYLSIYSPGADRKRRLDASTSYLLSQVAVPRILAFAPQALFIIILRDPVALAEAYHMEKVFNLSEDEPDFETAWRLQAKRLEGQCIPPLCHEPKELQYGDVAAIGTQLQRAMAVIPADQVLVTFNDDLRADPRAFWLGLQQFLGLQDDGRSSFPEIAGAHFNRFPALARLYQRPPAFVAPLVRGGKRFIRTALGAKTQERVKSALITRGDRRPISPLFRAELRAHFAPEVALVESLTGRDCASWKVGST